MVTLLVDLAGTRHSLQGINLTIECGSALLTDSSGPDDDWRTAMVLVLVILSSALLGLMLGALLCIRYVRQEMTARIGPTMDLVLLKLDNMQGAVNLAFANWQAELYRNSPSSQRSNRQAN
ncbi:MAG: hypothetical protein LC808_36315 [Actinobacteria bacterium]|nr:hypothetical protein [Actinomycetota bacterium]